MYRLNSSVIKVTYDRNDSEVNPYLTNYGIVIGNQ